MGLLKVAAVLANKNQGHPVSKKTTMVFQKNIHLQR
jgi:hypothetical protein